MPNDTADTKHNSAEGLEILRTPFVRQFKVVVQVDVVVSAGVSNQGAPSKCLGRMRL